MKTKQGKKTSITKEKQKTNETKDIYHTIVEHLLKKTQGWFVYNIKLLSQMRRNQILRNIVLFMVTKCSLSIEHEVALHLTIKRGEQALYTTSKYTGK